MDEPSSAAAKVEMKPEDGSGAGDSAAGTSSEPSSSSGGGGGSSADPAAEPTSKIATTFIGANKKAAIKFPSEYLKAKLLPTLDRVWKETEASPFHYPVNPEELGLPDYFNVVKKPMDLSTIKTKLDEGKYINPMEYVDDMWLMFNNAWLYNKKTSKVYKYCTKLAEVKNLIYMFRALFTCSEPYLYVPSNLRILKIVGFFPPII
jgi:E1A/CREB-binding protein